MTEMDKLSKSVIGRVKPAGSGKKMMTSADDRTEKKPPGRPAGGSKIDEKVIKKKLLVDKKSTPLDVKRTLNLLMEKVDSHKAAKSVIHKRVGVLVLCVVYR